MGLVTSAFVVFGAAALGLGAMTGLAVGLHVYHRRRSRLAGFAVRPSLSIEEGPALLGGTVHTAADESSGPVLAIDVPARPARGQQMRARPFTLVLPSGAKIGVEVEEGRWSLDTTFVPTGRHGHTVYEGIVEPGDVIYVRGSLRREMDPRAAGKGYRDVARRWVLRGDLAFCSAAVIAAHIDRAAFHRGWALTLGALFATVHLGLWAATQPPSRLGLGTALLTVLLVLGVGIAYRLRAETTAPWLKRTVKVR